MYTQAAKIIAKFRGARALARAIGAFPTTVYRWTYSVERGGTGGVIPTRNVRHIRMAARSEGILLSDSDWSLSPAPVVLPASLPSELE